MISKIIDRVAPEFTAMVKWGQGCWTLDEAPKVYIHTELDHLHFGFFSGSKLKDPKRRLVGTGKHVRHIKVFTSKDIDPEYFEMLIDQVA